MGPSIVLVHGIRTSATMWRAQVDALDAAGIPNRAVDLPGHGTRLGERFTLAGALDVIDEAVDALAGPVLVCGLSLGGYLGLHWAAERGAGRIAGMVAAACGTTPRGAALAGYRGIAAAIGRLPDRGAAINQFMIDRFIPIPGREDVVRGGVALDVMGDGLRAMAGVRPIEAIGRIRVPLLLVNGQFDHFRLEERRYLRAAKARPGMPESWSDLLVVPGASHLVSLTRPDEFSRILLGIAAGFSSAT
ncbi:MAG: alpha/beta hydrolase [Naasia sp.]|jgi:pimeloyl-ACP methyl ester carboxylesterase|uniref:alpha/beta fold hydrolase n=1 Tax=Naasia sp. TaxID=2546198 RepID=UPI00262320D8|nr:alpha/beta hydrolase [Naasia sp.]MCU1570778.1 alpha/beta hydrolase [Naasia sp.]